MIPFKHLRRILPGRNPPVTEKHNRRPTTSHPPLSEPKYSELRLSGHTAVEIGYVLSP
ncbi:hypothetical protein N181_00925 [Sinorhizobium fredii USDA 205]|nr:hypothetical protein SF83666_c02100 [Sinorhizobium fredii CCBAU 83666]AWM23542.1 hypothetical protein AOX55_0000259 [Sinorhizobium fredii CCBAU 25509]KSV92734.1 hypothetical protein N181_00925 [Sinorhizobium fredii USDA 205]